MVAKEFLTWSQFRGPEIGFAKFLEHLQSLHVIEIWLMHKKIGSSWVLVTSLLISIDLIRLFGGLL